MSMTKKEALQALQDGKTVTHESFTPTEWMKQEGHVYVFEDGCSCFPERFWEYRTDVWWETGWNIVVPAPEV